MTADADPKLEACYRTLELAPGASLNEIKNAYLRLKRLYSEETPVFRVLTSDFPSGKRSVILAEVEEAYRRILSSFQVPTDTRIPELDRDASRGTVPTGSGLKRRRETLGLSLEGISKVTKIRVEILDNIESERFETLPDESFLRNHLVQFARSLGLDAKDVLGQYLERYAEWRKRRQGGAGRDGDR